MQLKDAKELVGTEGISISGTISKVGTKQGGEGEYGNWTSQTIRIRDGSGELMVQLKNRPEELTASDIGKFFTADSVTQERLGKKTGVKIAEYEFQGDRGEVSGVKAVVTLSAILSVVAGEGKATPTASKEATAAPTSRPSQITGSDIASAKALMQDLIDWSSLQAVRPEAANLNFNHEDWQKLVTTMFIRLSR